jgi:hypothetical protein
VGRVTLTVLRDELEADMVCGKLRANGIDCSYRKTDFAAGAWTGSLASGGPIAVLVQDKDNGWGVTRGEKQTEAGRRLLAGR